MNWLEYTVKILDRSRSQPTNTHLHPWRMGGPREAPPEGPPEAPPEDPTESAAGDKTYPYNTDESTPT